MDSLRDIDKSIKREMEDIEKSIKREKEGIEITAEAKNKESDSSTLSKNALKHYRYPLFKIVEVPMEGPRNDNVMTSLRQLNYAFFGNADKLDTKSIETLDAYRRAYEKILLDKRLDLFFEAILQASFSKQRDNDIQEEYRRIQALFEEIKSGYDILKALFEAFATPIRVIIG